MTMLATLSDFLKGWGSLIIATTALLLPGLRWAYQKWIIKARVEVHETHHIYLGYSAYGPVINLTGTLRALDRDVFIRNMEVSLVRKSDSSTHRFEWGTFSSKKLILAIQPQDYEIPSGFMLTTTEPKAYNISFMDIPTQNKVIGHFARVMMEAEAARSLDCGIDELETNGEASTGIAKTPLVTDAESELDRLCYWTAGEYSMLLKVNTATPDRTFYKEWDFVLTPEDEKLLRRNVNLVIRSAQGQTIGSFPFAVAEYQKVS